MDLRIFANLKDRDLRRENLLIGEGRLLTERVLSRCRPLGVLASRSAAEEAEKLAEGRCPVTILADQELSDTLGYPFHRGILAAAERPELPSVADSELIRGASRLVALVEAADPENLGAIARSAAALGWDGLVLGSSSCDPFGRRALRCSMGATLALPLLYASSRPEWELIATGNWTALAADATVKAGDVVLGSPEAAALVGAPRLTLAFGNERTGFQGLWRPERSVAIPQTRKDEDGVDSLNVAAAAAILLWAAGGGRLTR